MEEALRHQRREGIGRRGIIGGKIGFYGASFSGNFSYRVVGGCRGREGGLRDQSVVSCWVVSCK